MRTLIKNIFNKNGLEHIRQISDGKSTSITDRKKLDTTVSKVKPNNDFQNSSDRLPSHFRNSFSAFCWLSSALRVFFSRKKSTHHDPNPN